MRKLLRISAPATVAAALAMMTLSGCGSNAADDSASQAEDGVTTITIGASPTPHTEILEFVQDNLAADAGLKLDIVEFDDYVLPNQALAAGDLDANYFQHLPYLEAQIADQGYEFTPFEGIHYEPYAIYSSTIADIADLPQGARVGLTNDPSNQDRALRLLEDAGVITLADTDGKDATILDVADNPKDVELVETAPEQLPRSLEDLDAAVINGNFAIDAGLSPTKDGIYLEKAEGNVYANILVVRTEDKDDPALVKLNELLHSDDVKQFIETTWPDGSVLPAF